MRHALLRLLAAAVLVFVLMGCPDRRYFTPRFQSLKKAQLVIDGVESSPENPVLLCGEEDLGQFLTVLACPNGEKFYKSLTAGLEREDPAFTHTTEKGYRVYRFDGACYKKAYEFYLTTDACEEAQSYK